MKCGLKESAARCVHCGALEYWRSFDFWKIHITFPPRPRHTVGCDGVAWDGYHPRIRVEIDR